MDFPIILTVEIALVIVACTRGWKGWPVLVICGTTVGGFLLGMTMQGQSVATIVATSQFLDIALIGVLIYMIAKGRDTEKTSSAERI